MAIVHDVLLSIDRPAKSLAIIPLASIEREYPDAIEFLKALNQRATAEFRGKLQRPGDALDPRGNEMILVTEPTKIREEPTRDPVIYVVERTEGLKNALTYYVVEGSER